MQYRVTRNGQAYGPYTLEDLQRYVTSGNVLLSDVAKTDDMPDWLPVSQILGVAPPAPSYPPTPYANASGVTYPASALLYPDPPNLPWGLLLLIDFLTCGLFQIIWNIIIAAWARRIQPQSIAIYFYIGGLVLAFANLSSSFGNVLAALHHEPIHPNYVGVLLTFTGWVVRLVARFSLRETLEKHYNGPEPLGLRLSAVMTFFFGGIYFMYKLNGLNEIKQAIRYRNATL